MAVFLTQNFNGLTVGQTPAGWTNLQGSWVVTASGGVDNGQGFVGGADGEAVVYAGQTVSDFRVQHQVQVKAGDTDLAIQGIMGRVNLAYSQGYTMVPDGPFPLASPTRSIYLFRRDGGAYGSLGSQGLTLPRSPVVGDIINTALIGVGSLFTVKMWFEGDSEPTSGSNVITWTDNTYASGLVGFYQTGATNSPIDNVIGDNLSAPVEATTYTLTGPGSGTTGQPSDPFTITIQGTTSGSITFTPSDGGAGGTFTPSTVVIGAGTNGTGQFTYTPASGGSKTISTTNSGTLTNPASVTYTAGTGPQTIPVTDSSLFWSPGSWDDLTVGTYGVATRSRQSANSGAYLKFQVQGSTDVSLLVDSSVSSPIEASQRPSIRYSVDGGPWQIVQINAQSSIPLVAGAGSATRNFEVIAFTIEGPGTRFSGTAGVSPTNAVRLRGLQINSGATMGTFPRLMPKRMIMFGDSITEGIYAGTGWRNFTASHENDDPLSASVQMIAQGLEAEYGQIGFGAQGWLSGGSAGASFQNTWNKFSTDRPRSLAGFDYVLCMHGTNDGYFGDVSLQARDWLIAARAAAGPNTWIFLVIPPGGFCRASLTTGFNLYTAAYPTDDKVGLISVNQYLPENWLNTFVPSAYSVDGLHPSAVGNALIGAGVVREIGELTGTGGGGGGGGESGSIFSNGPIL